MNYLAHSVISLEIDKKMSESTLYGNFAGDFYKGKVDKIDLQENLKNGIILHRLIDKISDREENFLNELLREKFRIFKGIVSDMYVDHFLCKNFENIFCENPGFENVEKVERKIIKNIEFMLGNEKDKKYAELINQGNEFVKKRDYENARKLFVESTNYNERGYLALAKSYYLEGNGEKTKETFEKAYELGVKEAAYEIGKYLDTVEKNEKEAEKWYKIGKEMGDARAIYALGMLYECNINFVKQDREEVNKLYEASADIKYAFGMEEMMYNNREKDEEKSKEWAFKILNESGLIELEEIIIKNVQDLLEELGENLDNKILTKDYEIEYDEDLIYFIQKKLGNPNFSSNYFSY